MNYEDSEFMWTNFYCYTQSTTIGKKCKNNNNKTMNEEEAQVNQQGETTTTKIEWNVRLHTRQVQLIRAGQS